MTLHDLQTFSVLTLKHGGALLCGICATTLVMGTVEFSAHKAYPSLNENTKVEDIPVGAASLVLVGNVAGITTGNRDEN